MLGFDATGVLALGQLPTTLASNIPAIIDLSDSVWAKKKKKTYDAAQEERETKYKRRKAIEEAIWPPTTYSLPEYKLPERVKIPELGDLPGIMMMARANRIQASKRQLDQEDEDDLLNILKDII